MCVCMCVKAGVDSDYVRCQIVTRKQRKINQGKAVESDRYGY